MFVPRIYYPSPISVGETLNLDKEMSHYLLTVLRLDDSDNVIFFNGEGGEYTATFIADKKRCQAHITHFNAISRESPLSLHLGQALARGDRMDFVFQKATELGVQSITPLLSANCGVKLPTDRTDKRLHHWEKIAQSACEQSGRTKLPVIHPPMTLKAWSAQIFAGVSLYGDTVQGSPLSSLPKQGAYRLTIGPESGWDPREATMLQASGFQAFQLGPRVLRTETAGLVALSILQELFGDMGTGSSY